jgi:hypothetical protein
LQDRERARVGLRRLRQIEIDFGERVSAAAGVGIFDRELEETRDRRVFLVSDGRRGNQEQERTGTAHRRMLH